MLADYSESFLTWLARRKPEVRARLLRLNPPPLDQGSCLRGYHPHQRSNNHWTGDIGKALFIRRYGRAAWAALPRCVIIHKGHRKAVSQETALDNLWLTPADHPIRRATKKNGQWFIPCP